VIDDLKINPEDFGGFQTSDLSLRDAQKRYCAAQFCSFPGWGQIVIPLTEPRSLRIVCRKHLVLYTLMISAILGDPSPTAEARRVADETGVDWGMFLEMTEPLKSPSSPENFICIRCGEGMIGETIGMYSGKRFVHTCGEAKR
jgi:hypothetical protein